MHGRKRRAGGVVLGVLGLILALWVMATLVFDGVGGCVAGPEPAGEAEVAVCYLERSEWRIFARGVAACVDEGRGLGRLVAEADDWLRVVTAREGRPVRFAWHRIRGEGQARDEVRSLVESAAPPVALVGSSNTLLTLAMSGQLRDDRGSRPGGGPLLLVPWATSMALLDTYPGRTFRFCSNNRRVAALLVGCLASRPGTTPPTTAVMVVDPLDPYSVDLADCIRAEIARAFPRARVVEPTEGGSTAIRPAFNGRASLPTATEQRCARAIWRAASEGPGGETWAVLPLQREPARRMIAALNGAAPGRHDIGARPLTLVCGDAVGQTTLASFANQLIVPVWSVATASTHRDQGGLEEDVQQQAEIVAAVLLGLDRPGPVPTADDLRASLLRPDRGEPASPFGRPLAFDETGEREESGSGEVMVLRPDSPEVRVFPSGRWPDRGGSP